jgi:polynucleotide 5'-kinase involved in rRNA processing
MKEYNTVTGKLEDFIKEDRIVNEIRNPRNKLIMVMGAADTGKTTLIECIGDLLAKHTVLGIVDLDMGQSRIGLPTTVAWGKIKGRFKSWSDIKTENFYFTGTLSPIGSLLPAVTGAKLITDKAISCCGKVIIDTTGLIAEPAGRVLKQFKIDLLSPDIILALEHSGELGHILDSFKAHKFPKIYRFSVPVQADLKSTPQRTLYRSEKFKSYFLGAHTIEVSYENIGIRFTRDPVRFTISELKKRIISFRDQKNNDVALGIIEKIHARDKKLFIRTPASKDEKFPAIVIGDVQIEL